MASFPSLPDKELDLASILSGVFNLDLTKKDLIDCKPELVQKIYIFFLKDFGANIDKINQVPMDAPASITQFPEMYKSTCALFGLAKTINYYLELIYKTKSDFGINDLILPNPHRTKKFFRMLWEFYDHLYHSLDKYDAVDNEADVEIEKFNKLKDRCKALENEINLREVNNEESEFCLQKEMEQFSEVEKEFDKVQIKKSNLKEQLETIKNESKTMISKIKKTELDILEGQEQIKILETQVIQDEEMAKIKEQEVLLTSVKDANDELKKQRRDLNRTLQSIKDKEKFITSSLLSILEEIETENTKNKEADSLGNEFKKISLALMEKLGDLSHTRQELIESMNMLQEKRAMLQSTKEVKKNGLLEEIKQLRLNVSELQSSKEKQSSMEKGLVAEIKKYKEEFRTKEIELKYFLSVVDESFNAMLKKISEMDMKKSRGRSLIVG